MPTSKKDSNQAHTEIRSLLSGIDEVKSSAAHSSSGEASDESKRALARLTTEEYERVQNMSEAEQVKYVLDMEKEHKESMQRIERLLKREDLDGKMREDLERTRKALVEMWEHPLPGEEEATKDLVERVKRTFGYLSNSTHAPLSGSFVATDAGGEQSERGQQQDGASLAAQDIGLCSANGNQRSSTRLTEGENPARRRRVPTRMNQTSKTLLASRFGGKVQTTSQCTASFVAINRGYPASSSLATAAPCLHIEIENDVQAVKQTLTRHCPEYPSLKRNEREGIAYRVLKKRKKQSVSSPAGPLIKMTFLTMTSRNSTAKCPTWKSCG
ncbi:hypothetical protein IWX46DRAFT_630768 [Phyllosticta citricarpa]|uniref:Uncharacterized protein n=1 Tax=Phyllosticta citricarpa TaxID=55181 RepID=A0ABR1LC35_9PEZI